MFSKLNQLNQLNPTVKKIFFTVTKISFFIVFFYTLTWWQQKDMLSVNAPLKQEALLLLDVNGQARKHSFSNGKRDTLIYFFAPWCNICHLSIDNLQALHTSQHKNLDILVVALDWRSIEEVDAFLADHQLTVPVLLGTNATQQRFNINAFPSYYLIDKNGIVKAKSKGYSTEIGLNLNVMLKR